MNTKLDQRSMLTEVFKSLDDQDSRQLLAFAAGYEAGKISNQDNAEDTSTAQQAS